MSIIIGADIVPISSNKELFEKAQTDELLGEELFNILKQADYRIFNLEVPLTDELNPKKKYGPSLAASCKSAAGMKEMDINLFTLANNHIMDQGVQGLQSTLQILDNYGISHVGAGMDLYKAQEGFYTTVNEKQFGIYACAEHEFSIAGRKTTRRKSV